MTVRSYPAVAERATRGLTRPDGAGTLHSGSALPVIQKFTRRYPT